MTHNELIHAVANETGLKECECRKAVNAVFAIIHDQVIDGHSVSVPGFGAFTTVIRKARVARNITKGTFIDVPEKRIPFFHVSKIFRQTCVKLTECVEENNK